MPIYKRGNVWWIDFYYKGRRYREGVGCSKKEAECVIAKRKAQVRENRFFDVKKEYTERFDDMVKEYLRHSEATKKSYKRDTISAKHLQEYFRKKRLSEITPKMVEDYKLARRRLVKPATVNRELAFLKHLFNEAIRWEKVDVNPVEKVKLFRELQNNTRVLSDEEEEKLLAAAPRHLRPMIITALETGMRRGEVLSLKWKDVDFEQGYLMVRDTKNGESRKIILIDRLTDTLKQIKKRGAYVFSKKDGTPYCDPKNAFRNAVKRAGIEYCRFHDCRHTFASRLVMEGKDLVAVGKILGHKSIAMTVRYSHPTPEHLRQVMEALNRRKKSRSHNSHHSSRRCEEAALKKKSITKREIKS